MSNNTRQQADDVLDTMEERESSARMGGLCGLVALVGTFLAVREFWTTELGIVVPVSIASMLVFAFLGAKLWRVIQIVLGLAIVTALIVWFSHTLDAVD